MVEAYLEIGIIDEARAAAAVLGYNYPGDPWYEDSYRLLSDRGLIETEPHPLRNRKSALAAAEEQDNALRNADSAPLGDAMAPPPVDGPEEELSPTTDNADLVSPPVEAPESL